MASTMTAVPPGAVPGTGDVGRKKKRRLSPRLPAARFLLPAVLLYGFVFIVPFIGSLPLSFSDWNGISRFSFSGIGNFRQVVTSSAFLSALEHNAVMVGSFFVLSNVVALGLALLLNRRPAGYQVYRTLIFLPAILSLVATGFIWTVLLDPQIGVVNPLLQSIGLGFIHPQWLSSPHLALAVVIVVSWWQWGGIPMVIYGAGLKSIPGELLDAAQVDGAVGFRRMRYVVLPLLRPAIVVTTVLTFVTAFQSFAVVYVLEGIEGPRAGPPMSWARSYTGRPLGRERSVRPPTWATPRLMP